MPVIECLRLPPILSPSTPANASSRLRNSAPSVPTIGALACPVARPFRLIFLAGSPSPPTPPKAPLNPFRVSFAFRNPALDLLLRDNSNAFHTYPRHRLAFLA